MCGRNTEELFVTEQSLRGGGWHCVIEWQNELNKIQRFVPWRIHLLYINWCFRPELSV